MDNSTLVIAALYALGSIGWLANFWWAIRIMLNRDPEVQGTALLNLALIIGIVFPLIGVPMGWYYLVGGPMRTRSEGRIVEFLESLTVEDLIEPIDSQIQEQQLWDQEWIKEFWVAKSNEQRMILLSSHLANLREVVRDNMTFYSHSNQTYNTDFTAVLRYAYESDSENNSKINREVEGNEESIPNSKNHPDVLRKGISVIFTGDLIKGVTAEKAVMHLVVKMKLKESQAENLVKKGERVVKKFTEIGKAKNLEKILTQCGLVVEINQDFIETEV